MSKAHKHCRLISEWASNPSGYVIWMAYGVGVDFTWLEAPTPCDWNESVQYKLVPLVKKEKVWVAYHDDGFMFNEIGGSESDIKDRVQSHEMSDFDEKRWQYKAIEVEV